VFITCRDLTRSNAETAWLGRTNSQQTAAPTAVAHELSLQQKCGVGKIIASAAGPMSLRMTAAYAIFTPGSPSVNSRPAVGSGDELTLHRANQGAALSARGFGDRHGAGFARRRRAVAEAYLADRRGVPHLSDLLGREPDVPCLVWLLTRCRAGDMAAFTFLAPVVGVFASRSLSARRLSPDFQAALAMVAGGILLVNWPARRQLNPRAFGQAGRQGPG
jgi:hypothetical protein